MADGSGKAKSNTHFSKADTYEAVRQYISNLQVELSQLVQTNRALGEQAVALSNEWCNEKHSTVGPHGEALILEAPSIDPPPFMCTRRSLLSLSQEEGARKRGVSGGLRKKTDPPSGEGI